MWACTCYLCGDAKPIGGERDLGIGVMKREASKREEKQVNAQNLMSQGMLASPRRFRSWAGGGVYHNLDAPYAIKEGYASVNIHHILLTQHGNMAGN